MDMMEDVSGDMEEAAEESNLDSLSEPEAGLEQCFEEDIAGEDYAEPEDTGLPEGLTEDEIQIISGQLQGDIEAYERNGYQYERNADGQILYAGGDLRLDEADRNSYAQRIAGGEYRHESDDGGHLIGTRFGGSGELDNLVAEDKSVNRRAFKTLENQWAKELEKGNQVHVELEPVYHGTSERPDILTGRSEVTEGDKTTVDYFSMTNENLEAEEFALPEEADEMLDLWEEEGD